MPPKLIASALVFSLLVPLLSLVYLGPFYAALFLVGYLGGFALWIVVRSHASWKAIRVPYWLTALAFAAHKAEENRTQFFDVVSSQITGTPPPVLSLGLVLALLIVPLVAWLAIPWLMGRTPEFGRFLAWTFFTSMGLTELAHFAMPVLAGQPYGYFPGMASALLLVPLGVWGMWRLAHRTSP